MSIESTPRDIDVRPNLTVSVADAGTGRPALVLHGGGGPATVAPIATHLESSMRVLSPTHPGWDGNDRPDWLDSVGELAAVYLELLAAEDLHDVLVIGSSIGGWIACEMAVRDTESRLGGLVLIDSLGIAVDGIPLPDFFSLTPQEIAEYSWYDGSGFLRTMANMDERQAAIAQANMGTLKVLAGDPYMHDPGLRERLSSVQTPAVAIWGDSDQIAPPDYGRALAASLGSCRFELIAHAGHLPQLEQPDAVFSLIDTLEKETA